jgi:hypothetical protein
MENRSEGIYCCHLLLPSKLFSAKNFANAAKKFRRLGKLPFRKYLTIIVLEQSKEWISYRKF